MTHLTFSYLQALESEADALVLATNGLIDPNKLEEYRQRAQEKITALASEWTPQRIKDFLLEEKRNQHKTIAKKITQIERENYDARAKGVSYKDRQTFTVKLAEAKKLLVRVRQEGAEISRKHYTVETLISPTLLPSVEKRGFTTFLREDVLGIYGYPL